LINKNKKGVLRVRDFIREMTTNYITETMLNEQIMNEAVDLLYEKLVVFGGGAKYGQIVFMAGGAGCFDENTLVKTADGYKKISEIETGDMVYTLNEETKEIELKPVIRPISYDVTQQTEELIELTFENGETVVCTENHLFYVNGEWIPAKDLEEPKKKKVSGTEKVYDLSIEGNHNYLITKSDIIVHNSGKGFASKTFMEAEKFKIRDVDEWKKAYLELAKLKNINPELKSLNLKNSEDVFTLHQFVKKRGIKSKTLDMLLSDVKADRLPNIIFDITGKEMSDFEEVIPRLIETGYESKNIHVAWVLTDFKVAYTSNLTRDRVVPGDVFLDTHKGAAKTMQTLIDNKRMPNGSNGRFVVIMNNRSNTVVFNTGNVYKGRKVDLKNQKNVDAKGVSGFYYITVKEAGKPFKAEETWKEELHSQIVSNVPGGQDGLDRLRKHALDALQADVDDETKKPKDREAARQGIELVRRDVRLDRALRKLPKGVSKDAIARVKSRL
jgi:hypothetical protein